MPSRQRRPKNGDFYTPPCLLLCIRNYHVVETIFCQLFVSLEYSLVNLLVNLQTCQLIKKTQTTQIP